MLLSATVSGMPDLSRLANCWVKVANSWSFGLRFRCRDRELPGAALRALAGFAPRLGPPSAAPPLAASTATGKSPNRSICTSAAERSATSSTPCTTSPDRRRALYENCGIVCLAAP